MNELETAAPVNPFSNAPVAARPSIGALANTDSQRAVAEVQAAMIIARSNPRDPVVSMDRILNDCTRPSLAEHACYQFARGGQDITGPSIRLAEAIAQRWGNIKTSVRELEQHRDHSTVQTVAWDLETGYQCDKVFQVGHIRHTKRGPSKLEDPRDIYENVANQAARRLRACILAVVPGDVVEAAVAQCEVTMKAKADTSPEAQKKLIEAFAAYHVNREQIEKRIQRRIDAIQPAQVVTLKKIYASLRDGMSVPADWFEPSETQEASPPPQQTRAEQVKAKLRKVAAPAIGPEDNPAAGVPEGDPLQPMPGDTAE